jgi:hypothetical protein
MPESVEDDFRYKYFCVLGRPSGKSASLGSCGVRQISNFPHFLDALNEHLRFSEQTTVQRRIVIEISSSLLSKSQCRPEYYIAITKLVALDRDCEVDRGFRVGISKATTILSHA